MDEVQEELPVSLRAGQPRVYDAEELGPATRGRLRRHRRSTRPWISGSRITPPRPTSSRPASNCGLTRTSASQPGFASRSAGGNAMRTLMNETSHVTRSGANGSSVSSRAFVRSSTVTRGSFRSRAWSWPRPTSSAITRAAPRWSRTSVKPPVDAPTSRASRPAGSTRARRGRARACRRRARRIAAAFDDELRRVVDLLTCLLVAVDESRHHECLRLRAALGEPALDEQDIQALAHERRLARGRAAF